MFPRTCSQSCMQYARHLMARPVKANAKANDVGLVGWLGLVSRRSFGCPNPDSERCPLRRAYSTGPSRMAKSFGHSSFRHPVGYFETWQLFGDSIILAVIPHLRVNNIQPFFSYLLLSPTLLSALHAGDTKPIPQGRPVNTIQRLCRVRSHRKSRSVNSFAYRQWEAFS